MSSTERNRIIAECMEAVFAACDDSHYTIAIEAAFEKLKAPAEPASAEAGPGFRIKTIVAFITVDPDTGDEGIIGTMGPHGWVPMIASDKARLDGMKQQAAEIALAGKMKISFCRFSVRAEEGVFDGRD